MARPAVSSRRVSELEDGRVRLELKRPQSDGTVALTFTAEERVERLASLVPPPRAQQVLYHGVLAGRSSWRREVVPAAPGGGGRAGAGCAVGVAAAGEDAVSDVGVVAVAAMRLRQVLLNLLSNAAKFTEAGTITVRTTREEDTVHIAVIDTGAGMDDAQLQRLFQAYEQVHDPSQREKVGGTGLGLMLSRELCRMMEGDLEVRSAPGEGSTFTVAVPLGSR